MVNPKRAVGLDFDNHASQDRRADSVELIVKGGDDAEIAAAAAKAPEEVLILLGAGRQEAANGGDHISREEIIDGKAVLAGQPA